MLVRFQSGYLTLITASAVMVLSQPVGAGQVAYEGFGPSFPIYANDGTGFGGPWTQGGFNAFASGYTPLESSLCSAKIKTSGGSVSGTAFSAINGAIRNLAFPLGQNNTTVYVSFLLQPQGTLHGGLFRGFFGLTLNGSLGNDLFVGKPGGGADDEYVLEARGGAFQMPSGTPAVVGRTALLVVRADFRPGKDVFTLYVDPKPSDPEPSSGAVEADLDLGVVSRIGIYSTGAFAIDEVRIGTTFSAVVPTSPHAPHGESHACEHDDDQRSDNHDR
ncbi:MAG TPA: hypothetical protein VFT38_13995 [Vicinamibacteria bacterium]|nr:hypothetical protein [Vicinamibacteria bacterium]